MRTLMPIGEEIDFDGRTRKLLFNVNVIDEIQEHYDAPIVDVINSIFSKEDKEIRKKSYDTISYIFNVLLNEDARLHNKKFPKDEWEDLTEEFLKEEVITNSTSLQITLAILASFNGSIPQEEEDPNVKSEQTRK